MDLKKRYIIITKKLKQTNYDLQFFTFFWLAQSSFFISKKEKKGYEKV